MGVSKRGKEEKKNLQNCERWAILMETENKAYQTQRLKCFTVS